MEITIEQFKTFMQSNSDYSHFANYFDQYNCSKIFVDKSTCGDFYNILFFTRERYKVQTVLWKDEYIKLTYQADFDKIVNEE